jgi:hypothetical protein
MKVLLDEQIDIRMKAALRGFPVQTLHDVGWIGLKNGALREMLNVNKFGFFITADKNLPFQQNFSKINFTLVLLDLPTLLWPHQQLFVPPITSLLKNPPAPQPKIIHIGVQGLSKGKKINALKKLLPSPDILFIP